MFKEGFALKSYEDIRTQSEGKISYMLYYGIYEVISVEWKRTIRSDRDDNFQIESQLDIILSADHISSYFYNEIFDDEDATMLKKQKWEEKINTTISCKEFNDAFSRIWIMTNFSKLRSF